MSSTPESNRCPQEPRSPINPEYSEGPLPRRRELRRKVDIRADGLAVIRTETVETDTESEL